MTRGPKVKEVMSSWWPGCLEKEWKVFTDGGRVEGGEEGLGERQRLGGDRQGSEKAVSKFMIFWKKLRGPTADALGSCGRKGCAQNREIKRGAFGYKCAQGECVRGGQAQRGRGQVTPVVVTGCKSSVCP